MPALACTWSLEIASDKLTLQFWFISNCSVLFGKKACKIQALQLTGLCLFPLFQVTGPQQTCCAGRQLDYCTLAIHPRTDSVEHSGDDNSVLINLELELRMQSLFAIREPRLLVSSGSISWVLTSWLCFCPVLWIAMCSCDTEHLRRSISAPALGAFTLQDQVPGVTNASLQLYPYLNGELMAGCTMIQHTCTSLHVVSSAFDNVGNEAWDKHCCCNKYPTTTDGKEDWLCSASEVPDHCGGEGGSYHGIRKGEHTHTHGEGGRERAKERQTGGGVDGGKEYEWITTLAGFFPFCSSQVTSI